MVVLYTEFWNKKVMPFGKVEMKAGKRGAEEFAKFVGCSYKLEILLQVIPSGDVATVVELEFVVVLII